MSDKDLKCYDCALWCGRCSKTRKVLNRFASSPVCPDIKVNGNGVKVNV